MKKETRGIDLTKFYKKVEDISQTMYEENYLLPNETVSELYKRIATDFSKNEEHKQRLIHYLHCQWMHTSTPATTNAGMTRGLPISCYVSKIPDSRKGIFEGYVEGMWLGAEGGGRGVDWSNVRGSGAIIGDGAKGTSSGVIPFLGVSDRQTFAVSQAGVRRSSETAYLHISHPDIKAHLDLKLPTGDKNRRTPNLHIGVIIPDAFMETMLDRKPWNLICPHTKEIVETVDAYDLWCDVLEARIKAKGEPDIMFIDNANKDLPEAYRLSNREVKNTNICTEIFQYNDDFETSVCCLASINMENYDEFKPYFRQLVADISDMLDEVHNVFQRKTKQRKDFKKARLSSVMERNIGIGVMGFHSYLQKKNIPFESAMAVGINKDFFSKLREYSEEHQAMLPKSENCELANSIGILRRNILCIAIAPTMSISVLCGVTSSGIEPLLANSFVKKTNNVNFTLRNKYLDAKMEEHYRFKLKEQAMFSKDKWKEEQWAIINSSEGSVRDLDWLSDWDKEVFKTAYEIDQNWLLQHAADRQPSIDQGQSLNLFMYSPVNWRDLYNLHLNAWKLGLKSLYYLRSTAPERARTTKVKELGEDDCVGCG